MQITLVQAEIETAIRNYVGEQVNVREGKRIDIELRATRGAEGYTCLIEINDEELTGRQVAPAKPSRREESSIDAGSTPSEAKVSDTDSKINEPAKQDDAPETQKSGKSIFSGLTKPDNSAARAAAAAKNGDEPEKVKAA